MDSEKGVPVERNTGTPIPVPSDVTAVGVARTIGLTKDQQRPDIEHVQVADDPREWSRMRKVRRVLLDCLTLLNDFSW